jgi:chloramphenicol-sensitive protein RarD
LQYLNPTIQLAVAVLVFEERFTPAHAAAFGLIWAALALYSAEALSLARQPLPAPAAPPPEVRRTAPAGRRG